MKRLAIILLILCACASVSYEEKTDAGSKYVFTNGLTVLVKDNDDTGMVAIDVLTKLSLAEEGGKHGINHFLNRVLLSGTTTRTREEIVQTIEEAGGTITARTYAEYNEILIEVPSNKFSVAVELLTDVLRNPAFNLTEVEKERTRIAEELRAKQDDPNIVAEELFMKTLFKDHPYQHPIDGYPETVDKITRAELMEHYQKFYAPNNIVVSIAGNVREDKTIRALLVKLGKMRARSIPFAQVPSEKILSPRMETQHMDLESFYIQEGYVTVPATNKDFVPVRVTQALLGSGSGSRLFYELRDKLGLAYSVFAIAPSTRNTGFLKINMISRPTVLNDSLSGIAQQIERVKTEPVSEEELNAVKEKLRGFFLLDHQKSKDQANYLALYELNGLGYQFDKSYPERIMAVSPAQVQYVAATYLNNPAIAVVGPFEESRID